jgi:hypothetical protein
MKQAEQVIESAYKAVTLDTELQMLLSIGQIRQINYDALTTRFEGQKNGTPIEGEWYGVFQYMLDKNGNITWNMTASVTIFAPPGELVKNEPIFGLITRSLLFNPSWLGKVRHRRDQLRNIHTSLSDHIQQANEEIYGNKSASQDRLFEKFSDAIRETSDYVNPFSGSPQQISNLYENVWINANGDVILTDESFNPNTENATKKHEWRKASK